MQATAGHPQILFIDGLPGSGKSTAAKAVGDRLPDCRVFAESAPNHPLLVGTPDAMGAAFANIQEVHSADSFANAALERLETFFKVARCDVLYVFESHPIQSTARVLFQLDAPQTAILQFWSDLQDRLAFAQPRLILFEEDDPLRAFETINRERGANWMQYVLEAFEHYPWMQARDLTGFQGINQMILAYADLLNRLADQWRFPMLKLPARPDSYELREDALTKWAMTQVT